MVEKQNHKRSYYKGYVNDVSGEISYMQFITNNHLKPKVCGCDREFDRIEQSMSGKIELKL